MGVRYWYSDSWGRDLLAEHDDGDLQWVSKDNGDYISDPFYKSVNSYRQDFPNLYEVFPAWASPSQPSEEKDLSDVNIIREALDGQRGEHQKLIAEYGVEVVATLIRKNSDYGGSAWQHPCLLQKLSGREGIQVRMSDKVQRLQKLLNGDTAQVAESIEDTMKDLVGYAMLWLAAPEEAR